MKKIFILFLLLFSLEGSAQENVLLSVQDLGADKADLLDKHALPTDDGGMIMMLRSMLPMNGNIQACGTVSNYEHHFRKYRYDNGLILDWERCYARDPVEPMSIPYFLFPADNGDFYTVRRFQDTDSVYKWGLAKEDAGQNIYWIKGYEANVNALRTVMRTMDGGFLLAFESYGTGGEVTAHYGSWMWEDIWLLKLDSLGNKQWSRTIGGSYGDYPKRIFPAPDSGYFLLAHSASADYDCVRSDAVAHCFVFRLDAGGNILWYRHYGGSYSDIPKDGCPDGKGGLLICGYASSNDGDINDHLGNPGFREAWVVNVDSAGNLLWSHCYGTGGSANAIARSIDGTVWFTGKSGTIGRHVDTSYGDGDVWTARIDSTGQYLSSKVQGTPKEEEGTFLYSFTSDITVVGGEYPVADTLNGGLPETHFGVIDVFLAVIAPWTTSIQQVSGKEIKCTIYPNPVENVIYVEMQEARRTGFTLVLADAMGKVVYTGKASGREKLAIPVQNMARGLYYLTITGSDSKRTDKIMLK